MVVGLDIQSGHILKPSLGSKTQGTYKTKKIARKPASAPKAEKSWDEALWNFLFPPVPTITGCGIIAEEALDKPRKEDAGIVDADADSGDGDIVPDGDPAPDGDEIIPDGDEVLPDGDEIQDADGDPGPNFCDNAPGAFNPTSPANGSTGAAVNGTLFMWEPSSDLDPGDSVNYTIIVADNPDLNSPVIDQEDLGTNQYRSTVQLANGTTYYWKVIAKDLCDQEIESPVLSFITVEDCATSPNAFPLTSPTHGSIDIAVKPTFDWEDSTDPDPDDSVAYRLEIDTDSNFSGPITFSAITESTYTLGAADAPLANGATYYWRVYAVDGCGNEVRSSGVYSFTTERECVPATITETAFLEGTFTNIDNKSKQLTPSDSGIFLYRDWTGEWLAEDGLPDTANPPWTLGGTGTPTLGNDPISSESAVNIDTFTANTDNELHYSIGQALSNSSGWVVQWRARLQESDNVGSECSLDVIDGTWEGRVGLTSSDVIEVTTASTYSFDPTTKMNTYRLEGTGANFRVYINEQLQIFGNFNTSNTASAQIQFGDLYLNQDGNSYWNSASWYTGSDHVPYLPSGEYVSKVYDLGSADNNIGDDAYLSVTADLPATSTISFETRTGSTSSPDASWSTWGAVTEPGKTINSPANQYMQIKAILQTVDTAETPTVDDITIDYCVR